MKRARALLCCLLTLGIALACPQPVLAQALDAAIYAPGTVVEDFAIPDQTGHTLALSALLAQYRAVALVFWRADCPFSAGELRALQQAAQNTPDMALLALECAGGEGDVDAFLTRHGLELPAAPDADNLRARFSVHAYPALVMIDGGGAYRFFAAGAGRTADAYARLFARFTAQDGQAAPAAWADIAQDASADTPEQAEYNLNFIDSSGTPLPGVIVTVCDEATCRPMTADAQGRIAFADKPYPYLIHVLKAPAGYTFDDARDIPLSPLGGGVTLVLRAQ